MAVQPRKLNGLFVPGVKNKSSDQLGFVPQVKIKKLSIEENADSIIEMITNVVQVQEEDEVWGCTQGLSGYICLKGG